MSKKIKPQIATLMARLLLVVAVLSGSASRVVFAQQAQSAAVNPKNAAVIAATAEVLQETSELRKLAVLRQVKSGAQTRDEIRHMVIQKLKEDSTPEDMRSSELTLKKFGLVPADFQFHPFIIGLYTEQVAGYYDPKTQQFYLADWIDVDGQKPVIAHELVHALQDQHFNLRRLEKWPKEEGDAELAAHALVEGDATLAMTQYILRSPLRAFAMLRAMGGSGSSNEQIDRAPRALRESLLFPYEQGTSFAAQLFKRGGWEAVSQAFGKLPESTEQILHAEKYFAGESPVKIQMPDLAARLGAGWKRVGNDVNGEWGLYLILDEFLKASAESKTATAGWGGDRFALYEQPRTKSILLAQLTVWDTEQDATEFFDAYAKRTALRYQKALALKSAPDEANNVQRIWQTREGRVVLQRRGTHVNILEGVPEKANVGELLRALRQ
ncbi:MAG TPA: hypothetical protein VF666_12135 [Pyrinomonadaceae bacterium]|jgi:hypothetical protein